MSSLAASVRAFAKLSRELRPFLATPISAEDAAGRLRQRLLDRERAFATLLDVAVSDDPSSPTARLLAHGGVEVGDVNTSVRTTGLEATLARLHAEGVRLTLSEMRGRVPIVRPGLEIHATTEGFANPLLGGVFESRSGGSTGARSRSSFDLSTVTDDAVYWSLFRQTFGLEGRPIAAWYPGPPGAAGLKSILMTAKIGSPPERWFSQTPLRWSPHGARYAILARQLVRASRGLLPVLEYVPPSRVDVVLEWIRRQVAAGRPGAHVNAELRSSRLRGSGGVRR